MIWLIKIYLISTAIPFALGRAKTTSLRINKVTHLFFARKARLLGRGKRESKSMIPKKGESAIP